MKRIYFLGWVMATLLVIGMAPPAAAQNLVQNGGFESPLTTTNSGVSNNVPGSWNAFPEIALDGWIVEWVDNTIGYLPLLEIQRAGVYSGASADTGAQWAELDSDWTGPFSAGANPPYRNGTACAGDGSSREKGSVKICQTIPTVLPGDYELKFAFGARPGYDVCATEYQNRLLVLWDGSQLDNLWKSPESSINWTTHTYTIQPTDTSTELCFQDGGYSDSYGTLLDSVSVTRVGTRCTYTQGYWKTHSKHGPASHDQGWSDFEEEPFFISDEDWYTILNTPPKKGNAYIILGHQYIAAYLNLLNNAASAEGLVDAMTDAFDQLTEGCSDRAKCIELADFLASYNEGDIGPGHCY